MNDYLLGHNASDISVSVEVWLFNSMTRFARSGNTHLNIDMPAGSDIASLVNRLGIPIDQIFLVFVNGKDITPTLHNGIRSTYVLDQDDVIAISGPVPYSWGYGAPIV